MAEPAVAHCPNCHAEYRAGVTICTDCGHLLEPGPPPSDEVAAAPAEPRTLSALELVDTAPPEPVDDGLEPDDLFAQEEQMPRRIVLAILSKDEAEGLVDELEAADVGARIGAARGNEVEVLVHDDKLPDAQAILVEYTGDASLVDDIDHAPDVEDHLVMVSTPRLGEAALQAARLQDAGIRVQVRLPYDPALNDWRATATLLVPSEDVDEARRILGIEE